MNGNLNSLEKEHLDKYGHLYDPTELISEKFKRYNITSAQNGIKEKNAPYVWSIATARKSFGNNISVYKLSNELLDRIRETTIDKMPDETPQLYKKPFIIEAHDKTSVLFGDINSIMGFYQDYEGMPKTETSSKPRFNFLFHSNQKKDYNWEISIQTINEYIIRTSESNRFIYLGANLFNLRPFENKDYWDFTKVDYNRNILVKTNYCDNCPFKGDCEYISIRDKRLPYHLCLGGVWDNLLSFITVFNYLLIATNTPLKEKRSVAHSNYTINKKGKIIEKTEDWITKYIYVDDTKKLYQKNPDPVELSKEGLTLKDVQVKRHLKRVAFGAGHSEREWRIIESYEKKVWTKEGDTKIVVGLKK